DKTSSIICAFGLAAAAPRSPYRHLELCGIALTICKGIPPDAYSYAEAPENKNKKRPAGRSKLKFCAASKDRRSKSG
ncbi:MAG: hypothetical protein UF620_07070, partial [Gemmiger sp.]|uniref:hypothetical protein n=1 Tax=Gemmiger sp. TaxID=2049027 RepID=UPI002E76376D